MARVWKEERQMDKEMKKKAYGKWKLKTYSGTDTKIHYNGFEFI